LSKYADRHNNAKPVFATAFIGKKREYVLPNTPAIPRLMRMVISKT
jgi:hypothetical protein